MDNSPMDILLAIMAIFPNLKLSFSRGFFDI
jgi:hypothetical protein